MSMSTTLVYHPANRDDRAVRLAIRCGKLELNGPAAAPYADAAAVTAVHAEQLVDDATAAAREGVRAGVVAPPDSVSSAGDAKINAMLGASTWTGGVTCATTPCAPDQVVTATVTLQFQTVVPLIMPAMFGAMNITQTATMRYE